MMNLEENILQCVPSLRNDGAYQISSPCTRDYNCIAWAIGRNDVWYWPYLGNDNHESDEYWPAGAPDDAGIYAFVTAMQCEGFELCSDDGVEEEYTKIALYELNGLCTHAARLLPEGMWTSKMGPLHDIRHSTPQSLEGNFYGKVHCYMKKKRNTSSQPSPKEGGSKESSINR